MACFVKSQVAGLVRSYLGESDPRNVFASPLFGAMAGTAFRISSRGAQKVVFLIAPATLNRGISKVLSPTSRKRIGQHRRHRSSSMRLIRANGC
jgi:hypothetical protein